MADTVEENNDLRPSDDEFGYLLSRIKLAKFLGLSPNLVDGLIKYDGLNEASFVPSKKNSNRLYIKPLVMEWAKKKAGDD